MPRDHGRILVTIWDDPDFVALTPNAQRLYMLLLSQRGINNAGMLPTQVRKWAKRSDHTTVADIENGLAELIDARFVLCDDETEETLVRSFVRNDGITKNANVFKNALACAEAIESPALRTVLADELRRLGRDDAAEVADRMSPRSDEVPTPFERRSDAVPTPAGKGRGKGVSHVPANSTSFHTRERERPAFDLDQPRGPKVDPTGWKLVNSKCGHVTQSTKVGLANEIAAMLKQGINPEHVAAGLDKWLTKSLHPNQLPHLVSDVILAAGRSTAAPTSVGERQKIAKPDQKIQDIHERTQRLIRERQQAQQPQQSPLLGVIDGEIVPATPEGINVA